MDGCWIETYYVKRSDPYSMYKDSFSLHVYDDFNPEGPNTWKGYYGKYAITIIQRHRHHDIKEGDVEFEKNPSYKEDPETTYAVPSKAAIAQALNGHLNRIYG